MSKILITSGGTKVNLDPVRYIANMSKGTLATKLAATLMDKNHEVLFLRSKDSRSPFKLELNFYDNISNKEHAETLMRFIQNTVKWNPLYRETIYNTFEEYTSSLKDICEKEQPDYIFLAAAVSDYLTVPVDSKIRTSDQMTIQLFKAPKVISEIQNWSPNSKLIGFKLLVDSDSNQLIQEAIVSYNKNKCNSVIANDLSTLATDEHRLLLVSKDDEGDFFVAEHKLNKIELLLEDLGL